MLKLHAVKVVVVSENVADTSRALRAASYSAVSVSKYAVADYDVAARFSADFAAIVAVAVFAGFDGYAVIAGAE